VKPLEIRRAVPGDAAGLVALARAVGAEPEGWLISTEEWRSAAEERRYLRATRRTPHATSTARHGFLSGVALAS